ncbi:muscarinic acetylcholine receptor M2-like [Mustelus asterias]
MMEDSSMPNESLNNSTSLIEGLRPYTTVEMLFIVTLTGSLSLVTIIGNILVIVSIKANRHLQTVNNYFLFSLACADFIIGVFSMNLYTIYIVIGYWPLGSVICDLWLALDYVVSTASGMNLLIISFDRYLCVTKPLSYPMKRTVKVAGIMITVAWVLPFSIWAPIILFWQFIVGERIVSEGECYVQFLTNPGAIVGTSVASFYTPAFIIIILSVQIARASKSRMKANKKEKNDDSISGAPDGLSEVKQQNVKITGEIVADSWSHEEKRFLDKSPVPSMAPSNPFRMVNPKLSSINMITMTTTHAEKRKGTASREKKVTRTVLSILIAFIVTFTPYFVMVIIYTICSSCVPYTAWTIGYWLCYINSTVNPLCYALCHPTFKKTFKRLLICQYKNIVGASPPTVTRISGSTGMDQWKIAFFILDLEKVCYPVLAAIGIPDTKFNVMIALIERQPLPPAVNVVTIVILFRGKCGLSNCVTRYLVAMAAADLLVIIIITDLMMRHIPIIDQQELLFVYSIPKCNKLKRKHCAKKTAAVALGTVTLLSGLKEITWYFIFSDRYQLWNASWFCSVPRNILDSPVWLTIILLHYILTPGVPFALIVLLNVFSIRHILLSSRARRRLQGRSNGESPSVPEMESQRKSLVLLFAISANFILLWAMYAVYYTWAASSFIGYESGLLPQFVEEIGFMLQLLSCCTKPFIYAVTQTEFREQLMNVFKYPFTQLVKLIK